MTTVFRLVFYCFTKDLRAAKLGVPIKVLLLLLLGEMSLGVVTTVLFLFFKSFRIGAILGEKYFGYF